jgi:hypothetical protein
MIGSVDLPYPAEIISTASVKTEKSADDAARTGNQNSAPPPASPHVIKFHDKEGRTGILRWDAVKVAYAGDLPAEASARGMFDSLWGKSYSCASGRLLSISDKTTPAPQPLHFRTDDNHSAEVYLDAQDGVKYSGDVAVDESAKPVFDALRVLFQCKSPVAARPK